MLEKEKIQDIVINALQDVLAGEDGAAEVNADTVLFGKNAVVDSMGLVNLIVDVESVLTDEGHEVSLTSEKAMSRRESPFRTVATLRDYIEELVQE